VISHAVTKGLNPNVSMKDSGVEWLGEVPEHWAVCRLKQILLEPLMYGANEAAEQDDINQPRYIRITDMNEDGTLDPSTFRSLPASIAQPYLLQDGDILLARSGATVGKSFYFRESLGQSCFAGYLIKARVNKRNFNPKLVYWNFHTVAFWHYVSGSQIQATIQNVSAEKYGNLYLALPIKKSEQIEITDFIDQELSKFNNLINKAQSAIQLMQERRTALISAAVTGKIDVRNWQNPTEAKTEFSV
jgi:restriction endonuclease S subunit